MGKIDRQIGNLSWLLIGIGLFCNACDRQNGTSQTPLVVPKPAVVFEPSPPIASKIPDSNATIPKQNDGEVYQQALTKAEAASAIAQSATSKDDWLLVASNLQASISMLQSISQTSSQYIHAAKVLPKYEQQLAIAQQKAVNFVAKPSPELSSSDLPYLTNKTVENSNSFSLPIKQKLGGIPVVEVTFNDGHQFPMLLDTGASRSLITKSMADTMQLKIVGTAKAKTANGMGSFSVATVDRVKFGEGITNRVLVAIADNDLNYGLLGHDVYDGYDITIKENSIEFRKR